MKFSVIIPVYNKAKTIKASIDSVVSQTERDFEIIIVDDGSTDELKSVLSQYNDLRVVHQQNGGVSVARNTGIKNALGEYVCFLDADDLWKEDHLKTLGELIKKYPACDYFVTSHMITFGDTKIRHSADALKNFDIDFECDDLLGLLNNTSYSVIHTNSICVKRSIFDKDNIYFKPGIKIGEDSDVWYRLALRNRVAVTKNETTVYRRENSTATKNSSHTYDWIFASRENEILSDNSISDKVKNSAVELIDRYKLNSCRELMMQKNRKAAKKTLKNIKNKKGKRYLITFLFCNFPYFLCRYFYKKIMVV